MASSAEKVLVLACAVWKECMPTTEKSCFRIGTDWITFVWDWRKEPQSGDWIEISAITLEIAAQGYSANHARSYVSDSLTFQCANNSVEIVSHSRQFIPHGLRKYDWIISRSWCCQSESVIQFIASPNQLDEYLLFQGARWHERLLRGTQLIAKPARIQGKLPLIATRN